MRDVVVVMRPGASSLVSQPRVVGLVVEVFGRRQIFAPMTRITSIDAGQVITTGLLNMRRFAKRSTETLVIGQMLDQKVTVRGTEVQGVVFDVAMEQTRSREWVLSRVAIQEPTKGFRRRGQTHVAEWRDVEGLAAQPGRPGRRAPGGRAGGSPAGRRRDRDPRPAGRASQRGGRGSGRRAARRRPRGAARGGPGRDPRAPRLRARRRRARGDVRRRRRRPDRRPRARDGPPAAGADGTGGGQGRPAADVLRGGDRRRHDDHRSRSSSPPTPRSPRRWPTSATRS